MTDSYRMVGDLAVWSDGTIIQEDPRARDRTTLEPPSLIGHYLTRMVPEATT